MAKALSTTLSDAAAGTARETGAGRDVTAGAATARPATAVPAGAGRGRDRPANRSCWGWCGPPPRPAGDGILIVGRRRRLRGQIDPNCFLSSAALWADSDGLGGAATNGHLRIILGHKLLFSVGLKLRFQPKTSVKSILRPRSLRRFRTALGLTLFYSLSSDAFSRALNRNNFVAHLIENWAIFDEVSTKCAMKQNSVHPCDGRSEAPSSPPLSGPVFR